MSKKKKIKEHNKEPEYKKVIVPNFSEEELDKLIEDSENLHVKLDIILHNQRILNYKLNKILDKHQICWK